MIPGRNQKFLIDDNHSGLNSGQNGLCKGIGQLDFVRPKSKFIIGRGQFFIGRLEFLIHGLHFFIGRLKLFVGGLQLFHRRLQLFVGGLEFFVGGMELFVGGLEFIADRMNFFLEFMNDGNIDKRNHDRGQISHAIEYGHDHDIEKVHDLSSGISPLYIVHFDRLEENRHFIDNGSKLDGPVRNLQVAKWAALIIQTGSKEILCLLIGQNQ